LHQLLQFGASLEFMCAPKEDFEKCYAREGGERDVRSERRCGSSFFLLLLCVCSLKTFHKNGVCTLFKRKARPKTHYVLVSFGVK
jgi:hypothetical protein